MQKIEVVCPYCGEKFNTAKPKIPDEIVNVREVECLPYTRDVDRFDPKSEQDYFNAGGWTKIGSDYLKWLQWEKIGILRNVDGAKILYRVQYCPGCKKLFDIFLNYSEELNFGDIWPHLFGKASGKSGEIILYSGENWIIHVTRLCGKLVGSKEFGGLIISIILFVFGLSPWLRFIDFKGLKLIVGELPNQLIPEISISILTKSVGCFGTAIILSILLKYVDLIRWDKRFDKLFVLRDRRGVNFWRNYTLCRFVGVQKDKIYGLSHVDIIEGGIVLVILVISWIISNLTSFRSISSQGFSWDVYRLACDFLFWACISYVIAIGTLFSLNTGLYVLKGVTRIPMDITPVNMFEEAKPLELVKKYSNRAMIILFFTIIGVTSILTVFRGVDEIAVREVNWLIITWSFGLAFLFLAVTLGSKIRFLIIEIIYLLLFFSFQETFVFLGSVVLYPKLIVMGSFFTLVMIFQFISVNSLYRNLIDDSIKKIQIELNVEVRKISEIISEMRSNIIESEITGLSIDYWKQYSMIYRTYESVSKYRNRMVVLNQNQTKRLIDVIITAVISPLFWSIILPTIWDLIYVSKIEPILITTF